MQACICTQSSEKRRKHVYLRVEYLTTLFNLSIEFIILSQYSVWTCTELQFGNPYRHYEVTQENEHCREEEDTEDRWLLRIEAIGRFADNHVSGFNVN